MGLERDEPIRKEYLESLIHVSDPKIDEAVALARWHRKGLLHAPWTTSLGRHGTQTWYPAGTDVQLQALLRARSQARNTRDLAWVMWWGGTAIAPQTLRQLLAESAARLDDGFTAAKKITRGEIRDKAEGRLPSTLAGVRKRVKAERFPQFLGSLLEAAVTGEAPSEEDATLIMQGLGMTRSRTDTILGEGPLAEGPLSFSEVSEVLRSGLGNLLDGCTDEDLAQGRDELRLFIDSFSSLGAMVSTAFAPGAFGLGAFSKMIRALPPWLAQGLLLLWIGLRRLPKTDGAPQVLEAGREWLSVGAPSFEAIQEMKKVIPAFEEVFNPKRMTAAFRTKQAEARFQQRVREIGNEHREEVDAFLAQHPDVKDLIDRSLM